MGTKLFYRNRFHVELVHLCKDKTIIIPTDIGKKSPYYRVPVKQIKNILDYRDIVFSLSSFKDLFRTEDDTLKKLEVSTPPHNFLNKIMCWYNSLISYKATSLILLKPHLRPVEFCNSNKYISYKRVCYIWTPLTIRQINNILLKKAYPKKDSEYNEEKVITNRFKIMEVE